ncbi:MAG: amidohydrolase family protein [Pseudohongiellaceae bacterium]
MTRITRILAYQIVSTVAAVTLFSSLTVQSTAQETSTPNGIADNRAGAYALTNAQLYQSDGSYRNGSLLIRNGRIVSVQDNERVPDGFDRQRNLPFFAGTAAAYGVDRETALSMVTRINAEILGVQDRVGTLEVGKDATLFISEGDALDMRTSQVLGAFIQGRDIDLNGTQQQLYERFRDKYQNQVE